MRMSDVPEIYVELIAIDEHPSGVGQMPVTVVAPAIGNAVARLTGVRLRDTPMTAEP
jgi:isoquinoline 1-oxidoreductase subunit beta